MSSPRRPRVFTRIFALALLSSASVHAQPAAPGPQAEPPGPEAPAPRELEMNDAQRRAVRGCPVDYDCHARLDADMQEFERRRFGQASSPWIEGDAAVPAAAPYRRADDPAKLRPDLPWLSGLQLPDLPMVWDERVIAYLEFYKDDPRGRRIMASWLAAQGKYRDLIADELRRAGLPRDLLYVCMIESSYDATEYSRAGASGLWQFMPGGGRIYGLSIDRWIDERNDMVLATRAAAYYFRDLYQRFGNWHLALAAYNAGYGAVLKGMAKYNTNDFWRLLDYENALPFESSIYVPKALAAAIVGNNRAVFGFDDLKPAEPVRWDTAVVPQSVKLSTIARAAGVSTSDIEKLNPQLRRGRTPPGIKDYVIRLPRGTSNKFAAQFPQLRSEWDDADAYVVRHGERFEDIATRYGISYRELRELNGIDSEAEVHGGMVLVVPKRSPEQIAKGHLEAEDDLYASGVPEGNDGDPLLVAVPEANFDVPGKQRVFYRVVSGDSQFSIATAFALDRHQLARWNGLDPEAHLHARMVLQMWVDKDFDADGRGIKLLDPKRIKVVESGSAEHLDVCEERVGRKRVVYKASRKETFEQIGKRYGLSHYDLARINRMSPSTVLEAGQEIFVYEVVDTKASDRAAEQAKKAKPRPAPAKKSKKPKKSSELETAAKTEAVAMAEASDSPGAGSPPDGPKAEAP